jgi:hypothetical protein
VKAANGNGKAWQECDEVPNALQRSVTVFDNRQVKQNRRQTPSEGETESEKRLQSFLAQPPPEANLVTITFQIRLISFSVFPYQFWHGTRASSDLEGNVTFLISSETGTPDTIAGLRTIAQTIRPGLNIIFPQTSHFAVLSE